MPEAMLRKLWRNKVSFICVLVILCFVLGGIFAPFLTPYAAQGRGEPDPINKLLPPSFAHPFGTDHLGRDLLARVLFGTRTAVSMALFVVGLALLIGVPLGFLAGYYGGWVDELIMRITDVFLSFPSLLLAIALASALGAGFTNSVIAIALTWWPWYTRIVRAQAIAIRQRPFVEIAQVMGISEPMIILRHVLPNTLNPLVIQATLDIGSAILASAALSFLGLGSRPPTADWGVLINDGRVFFPERWWYSTMPGMAIFLMTLSFSLIGDNLRNNGDSTHAA